MFAGLLTQAKISRQRQRATGYASSGREDFPLLNTLSVLRSRGPSQTRAQCRIIPRTAQRAHRERDRDDLRDLEPLLWRFERGWFLTFTPERRASESPMATAWRLFFALPLPRFILCICSRTYSPACVDAAFPWRFFAAALFFVVAVGILLFSSS